MDTYEFHALSEADIEAIFKIEQACHQVPWSLNTISSCFGPRYYCLGLKQNNQLLGFAFFEHICGEATLMDIAIAPNHQGQGLGRALLNQGIDWCRTQGNQLLWLEVRVSNDNAISLYQQLGFSEVAVRENYYPCKTGKEDALVMSLSLK
ncbi:ribosomal protein S18-alanine N-acetyltransferase [Catenovulum sp. SM1970]|uniref:ribosomal protein S18-alanine N-acetyltransferase n=1 Tax=Marinifaba aquimaris TaxID=2741323 RepID=UPI0015717988|nr:ribosomal protein S18-alanine N-acetyltransferase [Marinifaba aquimaris]NTS77125.1 ribosomal protein S18-alanine N-acetyltransferase [Marinifaba aquimaris]